jgi:hypothetical protein
MVQIVNNAVAGVASMNVYEGDTEDGPWNPLDIVAYPVAGGEFAPTEVEVWIQCRFVGDGVTLAAEEGPGSASVFVTEF